MDVGDVSDVSDIYVPSIFSVYPEDGGSIYVRDFGKISHTHKWYQPNNTINTSN
jgi:hypothetical protein